MPQPQRLRDWVVPQSEMIIADQVEPGLHHFQKRIAGGYMRYHLRVDPDGLGVLIAGASEAVLLSPAGVVAALGLLQDRSKDRLASEIQTAGGKEIVEDVAKVLAELGHPSSRYPIFNLVDPEVVGQRLRLPAPFQADVVVGPGSNMAEILDRLWNVHVPHVRFVWPASFPHQYVVRGVTHAEDLGMIAGVRASASQLAAEGALVELAECGLDYVVVPWGVTQDQHTAFYGEDDWEKLPQVVADIRRYEMTPVLDAPLHPAVLDTFDDALATIDNWNVNHVEVFALASSDPGHSAAFEPQALRQVATWIEDLADQGSLQLIWLPPVRHIPTRSLAATARCGPRAGGDVTIRVEMDGNVIPPRGKYESAGNILTERWQNIWNHSAFTRYRERVESPTRCDTCPGLAICAAALSFRSTGMGGTPGQINKNTPYTLRLPETPTVLFLMIKHPPNAMTHVCLSQDTSHAFGIRLWAHPKTTSLAWLLQCVVLAGVALVMPSPAAGASDYRFEVPLMQVECIVQPDSSVVVDYKITFQCDDGAHPIDIVDIGLPQRGYETVSGSIDGHRIEVIRKSEMIPLGVELHLGAHTIMPGESGTVHYRASVPKMVYTDTTNNAFASFQFMPTWYDSRYCIGTTHLQAAIHLPPGVMIEEVRFQSEASKYTDLKLFGDGDETHVVARWDEPTLTLSSNNPKFSLSFPRRVMTSVVTVSRFQMAVRWLANNKQVQIVSCGLLSALLAFLFFRFSHGTGYVLFFVLLGIMIVALIVMPGLHFLAWPGMLGLIGVNEWALRKKRSHIKEYLPAMATVEGGGIKRGLTAPQAAVLLELPLGRVLALVIFGMLKKNVLTMLEESPLAVEVEPDYQVPAKKRRAVAAKLGTVVHDYEHPFLDTLAKHQGPVEKCELSQCVNELVNSVVSRMNGFDLQATREYYQKIVKRAWTEAESIGDIQQQEKAIDRNFDWMMMDPHWDDMWRGRGYTYRPIWTWPRHTHYGGGTRGGTVIVPGAGGGGGGGGGGSANPVNPSLGEVAAGFAGWMETSAGRLASAVDPTALVGANVPQGLLDLSGVDRLTSDVFEALAKSSSRGGGGGGGGCACACAGCACACACAGGGR